MTAHKPPGDFTPVPVRHRHDGLERSAQPVRGTGEHCSERQIAADFEPVVLRRRHDGWTPQRQIAFIEKLAECGCVVAAAKHVGMSRESARRLRNRYSGRAFRDAWDAALDCGYGELEECAMKRSKKGVARPIFYKGEQVGEWRHFDERLTMFLLRFRRRHRFGPEADTLPRPAANIPGYDLDEPPAPFNPEGELDACLDGIEFAPEPPPEEPDQVWPQADSEEQ